MKTELEEMLDGYVEAKDDEAIFEYAFSVDDPRFTDEYYENHYVKFTFDCLSEFVKAWTYWDSYGVPGSDFEDCDFDFDSENFFKYPPKIEIFTNDGKNVTDEFIKEFGKDTFDSLATFTQNDKEKMEEKICDGIGDDIEYYLPED